MRGSFRYVVIGLLAAMMIGLVGSAAPMTEIAEAAGFVGFEDGSDNQPIRSTIPGLEFTTTAGYDWIYGDWRSGDYNGRYPDGLYTSNGNFFAWLGPNQGSGRIDFTGSGATYLSVWVSTHEDVALRGYDAQGNVIAVAGIAPNTSSGRLDELRIEAPAGRQFSYAIISGQANYWLIDDLATDAGGVPDNRTPVILLPGIMGTRLANHEGEVWPDPVRLIWNQKDKHLDVLRLQEDGRTPLFPNDPGYATVGIGDIIREISIPVFPNPDVYQSLIVSLNNRGYVECERPTQVCAKGRLFAFPYDWRRDLDSSVDKLEVYVNAIRATTGSEKVHLLAHSMGGLIARAYINDPDRAETIDTLVTLGTPYLGAPKAYQMLNSGTCIADFLGVCFSNDDRLRHIVRNMPGVYQLLPSQAYYAVYRDGFYYRSFDGDSDGTLDGWVSYEEMQAQMRYLFNSGLIDTAEDFHAPIAGFGDGTNGVRVFAFIGYGANNTPVAIREAIEAKDAVGYSLRTTIITGNGDNTVPLHSADLGHSGPDADLGGKVTFFYVREDHGSITRSRSVQRLAADLFEARDRPAATTEPAALPGAGTDPAALLRSNTTGDLQQGGDTWTPILSAPEPFNTRQVLVNGDVDVTLVDSEGREAYVLANGEAESAIPGVMGLRVADATSFGTPITGIYTISVRSSSARPVDIRVMTIVADQQTSMTVYNDLAIGPDELATLRVDPGMPDAVVQIDYDGDGTTDNEIDPLAVLDAAASLDITAPVSRVDLDGTRVDGIYEGLVQVTLSATDDADGSGLAYIAYSLDDGRNFERYENTFTIDAGEVGELLVKAVDRAGNEQYPLTVVRIGLDQTHLPLLTR
jgi:pimeloyl-ACP methyl ester carboxylesterase